MLTTGIALVPQWEALEGALLEAGMRDGCGDPGACANPLSGIWAIQRRT
jgi:hypothetical protein